MPQDGNKEALLLKRLNLTWQENTGRRFDNREAWMCQGYLGHGSSLTYTAQGDLKQIRPASSSSSRLPLFHPPLILNLLYSLPLILRSSSSPLLIFLSPTCVSLPQPLLFLLSSSVLLSSSSHLPLSHPPLILASLSVNLCYSLLILLSSPPHLALSHLPLFSCLSP